MFRKLYIFLSVLLFLSTTCSGNITSLDIDFLAHEVAGLIPEETTPPYEEIKHPLTERHLIGLRAFEKAEERILSQLTSRKIEPHEASAYLFDLAKEYLKASFIPEFHSFDSISKNIQKVNRSEYEELLESLIEMGELKKSISFLNDNSQKLFDHFEELKSRNQLIERDFKLHYLCDFSQDLLQRIDAMQKKYIHEYFHKLTEKTSGQNLQQTIRALYMSDLNELGLEITLNIEALKGEDRLREGALKNKKVVIFTCSYGTGHNMTALAVKQMISQKGGKTSIHDLSTGALLERDRWRKIFKTLGLNYKDHPITSVDLFNEILRNQYYFFVNTKDDIDLFFRKMLDISGKSGVASAAGILKNSWEKTQIREILLFERPHHVVTTYHMDLNPILEVAEELGIPVLHIPTDYNLKFWEVFGKAAPSYPHFKSTVPNESIPETMETKSPLNFSQLIQGIGIPLRAPFYSTQSDEECEKYRQSRGIEDGEKTLFFSAGGNGQHLPHPEILANSSTWEIPLRIEVIAGKNRDFVEHLQKYFKMKNDNPLILQGKNRYVTIEIVRNPDENKRGSEEEFFVPAEELSKILDISDISIAKAGGLSTAELLFKGVPIVFDHRVHPFSWELFNIRTVINNGRGYSNFSLYDLEEDLIRALSIPKERSPHFYFEDAAAILCDTIHKQIQDVEIKSLQN